MTEGGGTEITTMPVLQSLAHAREKWSNNATETIWDASIVKIILSSTPNSLDLQNLTTQRSIRRMAIMPADVIHTLAIGTGVILLRELSWVWFLGFCEGAGWRSRGFEAGVVGGLEFLG
ncbi:TraM recognition domain-containing protein [Acaricomes phytoseiuli]|uniref:TraM recognition domain-containing protein n=1 Tax=Acaricomes phytoseiuli TaxID=291968 RepID=UPI0038735B01